MAIARNQMFRDNHWMEFQCDICGQESEDVREVDFATLYGLPMQVCDVCKAVYNNSKQVRDFMDDFKGLSWDPSMSAVEGIRLVEKLEREFDPAKHASRTQTEATVRQICRMRSHFERKMMMLQ